MSVCHTVGSLLCKGVWSIMCRWMELVEYTNMENILHMHQPKIFAHLLHPLLCECQQNRHDTFDLDKLCSDI